MNDTPWGVDPGGMMTRQIEQAQEERQTKRRDAVIKGLEYELPGALEMRGITMLGFAVKFDAYDCLMTIKADVGGTRRVCFIGGSSVVDCIIKSVQAAKADRLRWRDDEYIAQ